jgi:hypothetical protein
VHNTEQTLANNVVLHTYMYTQTPNRIGPNVNAFFWQNDVPVVLHTLTSNWIDPNANAFFDRTMCPWFYIHVKLNWPQCQCVFWPNDVHVVLHTLTSNLIGPNVNVFWQNDAHVVLHTLTSNWIGPNVNVFWQNDAHVVLHTLTSNRIGPNVNAFFWQNDVHVVPAWVCLLLVLCYVSAGASLFCVSHGWNFIDSFFFWWRFNESPFRPKILRTNNCYVTNYHQKTRIYQQIKNYLIYNK